MPGGHHLEYGRVRQLPQADLLVLCFDLSVSNGHLDILHRTVPELVSELLQCSMC